MLIYGIDPGSIKSGVVLYDTELPTVRYCDIIQNCDIWTHREISQRFRPDILAIEMVAHYGRDMPAGASLFDTCLWIGRMIQAWNERREGRRTAILVYRRDIKLYLCDTPRSGDKEVRQALLDRFGGTRKIAIGTKRFPGPLYGMKSHTWNALAVAIVAHETIVTGNKHWLSSPMNEYLVA